MSETWDKNSNCYGYAVKIKGCGLARPGSVTKIDGETTAQYAERLKQGVLNDGGDRVSENAVKWPSVPANAKGHRSLVVMIVGDTGFHFLRRERTRAKGLKRWKWKQGCQDNEVVTEVWHGGQKTEITNNNLAQFINNPASFTPSNGMPNPKVAVYFFDVDSWGFKSGSISV
jgi:hypothetical protein